MRSPDLPAIPLAHSIQSAFAAGPALVEPRLPLSTAAYVAALTQSPPAPPSAAAEPAVTRGQTRGQKIWQLAEKLHCPVLGACLPLALLRKLARRFAFSAPLDDDYALHVEAVGRSHERTAFTVALQHVLDRRYAEAIRRFAAAAAPAEVYLEWRRGCDAGDIAGALWAAVTHRHADADVQTRLAADVHMLSHQVSAGLAADVRQRAELVHALADAREQAQHQQDAAAQRERRWQTRLRETEETVAALDAMRAERDELARRLATFENGIAMVALGRKVVSLTAANEQLLTEVERTRPLQQALDALRIQHQALQTERDRLADERDALEALHLSPSCIEPGPSCPLPIDTAPPSGCRVLCVGGRTPLVGEYRKLAERLGIRLIHHDGGVEESLSRLPDMINGADAVICPTDCVSHPAYYRIKHQCKRQGKPCLMFKGAGVSSVAAALMRVRLSEDPQAP